jgi:HEAT repeat protein
MAQRVVVSRGFARHNAFSSGPAALAAVLVWAIAVSSAAISRAAGPSRLPESAQPKIQALSAVPKNAAKGADRPAALADPNWQFSPNSSCDPLADWQSPAALPAGAPTPGALHRAHRWQHPGLEALLNQPIKQHPDWFALLNSAEPIVATNAAIVLARAGDPAAKDALLRAVNSAPLNLRQRQAAIEALADIRRAEIIGELKRLVDNYGDFSGPGQTHYVHELHAELLRSLAWSEAALTPGAEPRFAAAITSPSPLVRREALLALADARFGDLPATALRAENDTDPRVRQATLVVLAVRRHPAAQDAIRRALMDQDLSVRLAAVAALGHLGGAESQTELRRLAVKEGDLVRAAAIEALAKLGDWPTIAAAGTDKAWQVRLVVARRLSLGIDPAAPALARQLVMDVNSDVAQAAIRVVATWPIAQAGVILLDAMDGRAFLPRKTAAERLGAIWAPAANFEFEAATDRRSAAMIDLRRQWREQFGASGLPVGTAAIATSPALPISSERVKHVADLLDQLTSPAATQTDRRVTIQALIDVGADLIRILERYQDHNSRPLPEVVYREVLPRVSPEFSAIEQLHAAAVLPRRQAIDAVRAITHQRALPSLALDRLAALATQESDPLVWSGILSALADDGREPAIRLAYVALGHPTPDVRRRACEYLAAHPEPRHGPLLSISLADSSPTVVHAAVRALGQLQSLDDSRPLERLLAASDHGLRVDVAESLARLRKPAGCAALERLAHDPDPGVRRRAAMAMGQEPDVSFVPALIAMLDDRSDIRRAALTSLPRVTGKQPQAAEDPQSDALRWKQWYQAQAILH